MTKQIQITANDEVIVTELRPMSDAPSDESDILLMFDGENRFELGCIFKNGQCYIDGYENLDIGDFIGWMPLPTYKPK